MAARLQSAGLRVTGPRLTILEALAGDPTHPTAEAVYNRLRPDHANLSLSTVYNAFEDFVQAGICMRLLGCGPQMRVDPNCHYHWHAVCVECGRVEDYEPPIDKKIEPPAKAGSMIVNGLQVQLNGLCPKCHRARQARNGHASH